MLHVAASHETKRWRRSQFIAIAKWLRDTYLLKTRVIAGPGQDHLLERFSSFETMLGLDVKQLCGTIGNAALFVGNDSGPAHIAAAYQIPTVVIFADSDSSVWGPWKTPSKIVESAKIDDVGPSEVKEAIKGLLSPPEGTGSP